ncbi:response regulator [Jannaschia sp. S6380]|uniref:response regulator n=1 Tax=Jannaschia sp. S6380 TaxID=2926408 RepID=UPI001FF61AB8|nr:response regulator [Jannaschia sp. S6380]MCK0167481.1 response regulator [Jannaschia sp. S6380]
MAKRVMIVDDEALIAIEFEFWLQDEGHEVAGIAGDLDTAISVLDRGPVDAVLLDANLDGVSSAPLAEAFRDRGVPFAVVSGYSRDQIDWLRDEPLVSKPVDYGMLSEVVRDL